MPAFRPGVRRIQHPRGEEARVTCGRCSSRRQPAAGKRPASRPQETEMKHSPYLDKPLVPLAVALRSMLMETETKIVTAGPAEKARLQQRAEVLREWLTLRPARSVAV
jgi:hypothetical protein